MDSGLNTLSKFLVRSNSSMLQLSPCQPQLTKTRFHQRCVCLPAENPKKKRDYPLVWNELRNADQLIDGIFMTSDDKELPFHRVLLCAASPYFRVIFTENFTAGRFEKHRVSIDLPAPIVKLFLDYVYTGESLITRENVQDLLIAADRFEMLKIVKKCCEFLLQEMAPENCLGILKFAKNYFCHDLQHRGESYIRRHFKDIFLVSYEFKELSFEELRYILGHDELNVRNEEIVFEAISKWIAHDPIVREQYLPQLSRCVRYGLMSAEFFFSNVPSNPYFAKNKSVLESLHPARTYLAEMSLRNYAALDLNLDLARPRVPPEIVFAIGGWSAGSPTSFVETYDTRADRWFLSINTDSIARAYHGICALRGLIYMVGGFDGTDHFNTVRCFDPTTRRWTERSCMYNARCYVSVAALDGLLYAMGGFNGRSRMKSVERYCPSKNQWEMIASMNNDRSDGCATTLNEKIYIAGGFNGTEVLSTVECYDLFSDQWTQVMSMSTPRSGVSLLAYRDRLYALGGFNGFSRLQTGEWFNPVTSIEWLPVTEMFHPRSNFSAVVLDNMILVVGGFNGATTVAQVECYDGDHDEWYESSPMNLNRSALGACVLDGLPNAREYSFLAKVEEFGQGSITPDMMAGGEVI